MTKYEIFPKSDVIIVRELEEDEDTQNGIYISSVGKDDTKRGEVIAIGTGKRYPNGDFDPITTKIGDLVAFNPYSASKLNINNEKLISVREVDITATLRKIEE